MAIIDLNNNLVKSRFKAYVIEQKGLKKRDKIQIVDKDKNSELGNKDDFLVNGKKVSIKEEIIAFKSMLDINSKSVEKYKLACKKYGVRPDIYVINSLNAGYQKTKIRLGDNFLTDIKGFYWLQETIKNKFILNRELPHLGKLFISSIYKKGYVEKTIATKSLAIVTKIETSLIKLYDKTNDNKTHKVYLTKEQLKILSALLMKASKKITPRNDKKISAFIELLENTKAIASLQLSLYKHTSFATTKLLASAVAKNKGLKEITIYTHSLSKQYQQIFKDITKKNKSIKVNISFY